MRELFEEAASQPPQDPRESVRASARAPLRKRFYKEADVTEAKGGFAITLDGKPIRTPSARQVVIPSRALADAVAAEWAGQGEAIDPVTMPLTRIANSVVEGVVDRVELVTDDLAKYFETDLLFYRAGHPEGLVAREAAHWDPVLFWAAEALGAHFILSEGIMHVKQPDEALRAARAALPGDPWSVAALHVVTTLTAAHVDEDWNIDQWGVDEEAAARRATRLRDFEAAVAVLTAVNPPAAKGP
jgi:chaperone required for assembly of F1-ATPase